jgi:hypothetical protein
LCVAGARLFVLADANEKLIHELSLEGREAKVLRSFAEPKSHHPVATNFRPLLIFGSQLACSPDGTKVALVPRQLGEVRVFSTVDGRELLFTRLTPFQEIGINAMDRGFRYSNPGGVFQLNVALQVNDRGAVTVQIATFRTAGGRPRPDTFEFRSLSTTGSTMTVRSAHTVLGAVSATRVACTREDPFPQLMVYDRAHLGTQLCP